MKTDPTITPILQYFARLAMAWALCGVVPLLLFANIFGAKKWNGFIPIMMIAGMAVLAFAVFNHARRIREIAGRVDDAALAPRQRREFDLPMQAEDAYELIEEVVREMPGCGKFNGSLQTLSLEAKLPRRSASTGQWNGENFNRVAVRVERREEGALATVVCEPDDGVWFEWLMLDQGTNLENAEFIARGVARRVAERRREERSSAERQALEKELAEARLALLQSQIEPHFLYNTLANAQTLTRSDPAGADTMLGHLIHYLRMAVTGNRDATTLESELDRVRAYLDIMRIRMAERLKVEIDVPPELRTLAMPPMMLQTLVENAIKHGLEPKPGGGAIWIGATRQGDEAMLSVADDGIGFSSDTSGSGIGIRNVRERLALMYGGRACFALQPNFPCGVTATIRLPYVNAATIEKTAKA